MGAADSDIGVTLDADASGGDVAGETVTIGAVGSGNEIGALTITGPDGITLTGNITLSNKAGSDLDIDGPVIIDGDVVIDTDNASASRDFGGGAATVHEDGLINFSSTINAEGAGTDTLTIHAGDTAGNGGLTMSGAIGGTNALDALSINATSGTIAISLPQIGSGTAAGAGSSTLAAGSVLIGNDTSGDITFSVTDAAAVIAGAAGDLPYLFGGNVTFKSNGDAAGDKAYQVAGDTTIKNTLSGSSITFSSGTIELDALEDLTVQTNNGAISLGSVIGTDGGAGSDLTVNAGTSTTSLSTIGTNINDLIVSGSGLITISGDITTADYTDANNNEDTGSQSYTGGVVVSGGLRTLTTGSGGATFSSTINSESGENRALTIANTDGNVSITGAIGTTRALGALIIGTAENGNNNSGNITLSNSIGSDGAAGAASISIGNSATGTLTLGGADYNSSGAQMFESNDFDLDGANIKFTSAGGTMEFLDGASGQIKLENGANLEIVSGGGDITIKPGISGTAPAEGNTKEDVIINAGSGTICLLYTSPSPRDNR